MLLFLFAYTEENFPTLYFPFSFFYLPYFSVYTYVHMYAEYDIYLYESGDVFSGRANKASAKMAPNFFFRSVILLLFCVIMYNILYIIYIGTWVSIVVGIHSSVISFP